MTGHSIRVENMESLGNFNRVIIEESLKNIGVLENVAIISTRVEPVTEKHTPPGSPGGLCTPWKWRQAKRTKWRTRYKNR